MGQRKSASLKIEDLPDRIGGKIIEKEGRPALELPYFNTSVVITPNQIIRSDGSGLTRYEQVFIYNHMAQGGRALPSGKWRNLVELPNTVSKIKTMKEVVETPLIEFFQGNTDGLKRAALTLGGKDQQKNFQPRMWPCCLPPCPGCR